MGYNGVYHGMEALTNNPRDCEMWWDALRAKYDGKGKVFGRKEFDQLLGHCQAISDIPAICFAEDLIRAYPEAKVILTVRDVDKWHESAKKSVMRAQDNHPLFFWPMVIMDQLLRMPWRWSRLTMLKAKHILWGNDFEKNGRRAFEEHYKRIQSLVPSDRLLLYHVSDGWEPLCKFLGQPIPSFPMPHLNDTEMYSTAFFARRMYHFMRYGVRIAQIAAFISLMLLWGII
ncbi:hypothetical protein IFM61606_10537 [Aspergillus udagawae]|nr:hypothetical protein IFM61606_10537 [Aspergillus udagawae]